MTDAILLLAVSGNIWFVPDHDKLTDSFYLSVFRSMPLAKHDHRDSLECNYLTDPASGFK